MGPGIGIKRHVILAVVGIIVAIAGAGKITAADTDSGSHRIGVVIVDRLNLRPSPGTSEPPITVLQQGDTLAILEESEEWWIVSLDGLIGYISRQERFLRIVVVSDTASTGDQSGPSKQPAGINQLSHQVEELQRRIADQLQAVAEMTEAEQQTLNRLHAASRSAAASRARLKKLRADIKDLEKKIADTEAASEALLERTNRDADYIKKRLTALYKLNQLGNLHVLASSQSISDLYRRQSALESILARDQRQLAAYVKKKTLLQNLKVGLERKQAQKKALKDEASAVLQAAERERKKKKRLLARVRNEKSLELASLSALKQAAKALDRAMDGLNRQPITESPEKNRTSARFSDSKGLLKIPTKGKIINFFGLYRHQTYNVTNFHGGIDIQAGLGEPVMAVWPGEVVFSDWFQGYGNLIIVNHGGSYHTLYGHLEERFKIKGDRVEAGEVIATVGDTGPVSDPRLHFQVRHHGKALDPLEWIRKGS